MNAAQSLNSSINHLKNNEVAGDPFSLIVEFGEMLPKEGVKSLPDYKVMAFLRLLTDYQSKMDSGQQYLESKKAIKKFKQIAKIELQRQIRKMQNRQTLELFKIEGIQRQQFIEFTQAWDIYMQEYESAAYESLKKLREKHDIQRLDQRNQIFTQYHSFTLSKRCCEIRDQERKHFVLKEYIKANKLRSDADELEILEIQKHQQSINFKAEQKEKKLRKYQQLQINSLMKRIQRDRDEQLIHRQTDSRILIQRNKNMLADVIERQQVETKNTMKFLKYALGKRAPKNINETDLLNSSMDNLTSINRTNESIKMTNKEQTFDQVNRCLFMENSSEMLSYRSSKRKSIIERARSIFSDTFHKRPADLMKFHMKKYIKQANNSVFGNYTQEITDQNSNEESVKSKHSNEQNINQNDSMKMPFSHDKNKVSLKQKLKGMNKIDFITDSNRQNSNDLQSKLSYKAVYSDKISLPEIIKYNVQFNEVDYNKKKMAQQQSRYYGNKKLLSYQQFLDKQNLIQYEQKKEQIQKRILNQVFNPGKKNNDFEF